MFYAEPFWKVALIKNFYFSAIFPGMLLFHVGEEHSNLRLQEIDTSGLDLRQRSTQGFWVGIGM